LRGTSFRNAILRNVSFKDSDPRKANFDGATMDKLTFALLKGYRADLTNVTLI
jgi:BTB/POZ domain-containing protein KCTD9